ncbi:MAG: hemolysin family protein [Dehalococcoidia bacterium]
MSAIIPSAIVLALIALNALFVAAEFAIVGAPRVALERMALDGHRRARLVLGVLDNTRSQDRYIATAQIGITLATLGLGMYGEHQLAHWIEVRIEDWVPIPAWLAAHAAATVLAVMAITYLHVVIGEMVPKSLALQHAAGTALHVTPLMVGVRTLLFPLVLLLNTTGNVILRLLGIDRSQGSQDRFYTPEELEFVVDESLSAGLLEGGSGHVLRELFDLGALTADDIMAPRVQVHGLPAGAGADEITSVVREHPHTRYPVYEGTLDNIVGVAHVRDLTRLLMEQAPLDASVVTVVPFLPASTPLESVVRHMRDQFVQFVVVLDEHGGTAGIITPDDVSNEIVGRVDEAHTQGEIYRDAGGRLHVAGTVRLDELGERLDCTIEHAEVETVSGLVLALLERPPQVGDTVEYEEVRIQVARVDGRGVTDTVVARLPSAADPG